ncbi:hypothetical protein [Haloechinothrix salitolerans]|uniref:REase associating with pPIWI RE domain-containing protein n=1 Tax=Haloechinothrix salitolerans TaxID=926830 RepID=A0ABW2BZG8_9PSEU
MLETYGRRGAVATAALRSAVAWSRRREEQRAWREVARMTGVIMHAFGPGAGPSTPAELVAMLHRPLGELLPAAGEPSVLDTVVLLGADGVLSDEAMEIACDYTQALFDADADPATEWLPRWAWQRGEQVERQLFQSLVQAGGQAVYTASRRFVVERPAGDMRALIEERTTSARFAGARQVADYIEIPVDRQFRFSSGEDGACWWPCPVCLWPMRVRQPEVRCSYGPHEARFRLLDGTSGAPPGLVKISTSRGAPPRPLPVAGARCVDPAVWRFITVPGVPEVALERLEQRFSGVTVALWPVKDTFDALVTAPDGRRWAVDVKDHVDARGIVDDPPAAQHVVVPNYRKGQVTQLRRLLPEKSVWTMKSFVRQVGDHVRGGETR